MSPPSPLSSHQHKRVSWRVVHTTFVCAHSEDAPHDDEWNAMMEVIRKGSEFSRILVFTYGGAPNAAQRIGLTELLKSRRVPVAVLTPSLLARGAGTALHWFYPLLRVFEPDDLDAAFVHLHAPSADQREIIDALAALKTEVTRR